MKSPWILGFLSLVLVAGCSESTEFPQSASGDPDKEFRSDWTINAGDVVDGGPGKDGIRSIDDPSFSAINQVSILEEDDLVLGIKIANEVRLYPHRILDWHEIVNDEFGHSLAISYCPLTGTGIAFDRTIESVTTEFGVSGLLYNANLIPYDRNTDSNWSQILRECVNGDHIGFKLRTLLAVETTWKTWKERFPDARVLDSPFGSKYESYPYGPYRTDDDFLIFYPAVALDDRLPNKERVLGLFSGSNKKVYRFSSIEDTTSIITDALNGQDIVIVGNRSENYMVAFQRNLLDGTLLEFTPIQADPDAVMKDQEGNLWNIFGEAISGQRAGQELIRMEQFIGYWFAMAAFFPGIEIFKL